MKTRVQKWGNSLALRIPKSFAVGAGLHADAAVRRAALANGIQFA
jgi:antitoxin component of MazEF toxin-antitoxin module